MLEVMNDSVKQTDQVSAYRALFSVCQKKLMD